MIEMGTFFAIIFVLQFLKHFRVIKGNVCPVTPNEFLSITSGLMLLRWLLENTSGWELVVRTDLIRGLELSVPLDLQ